VAAAKKAEREAKKARGVSNLEWTNSNRKRVNDDDQPGTKFPRLIDAETAPQAWCSVDGQNKCCVCFELFQGYKETGDWMQCACKRWLHEDCIADIVFDKFGRELFCPYCSL